jgi:hypothetical protein
MIDWPMASGFWYPDPVHRLESLPRTDQMTQSDRGMLRLAMERHFHSSAINLGSREFFGAAMDALVNLKGFPGLSVGSNTSTGTVSHRLSLQGRLLSQWRIFLQGGVEVP